MGTVGFWGYLCARRRLIVFGHGLVWIALLLNTIPLLAVETTPGTEVIIAMNYVGMITVLIVSALVLLKCRGVDPDSRTLRSDHA